MKKDRTWLLEHVRAMDLSEEIKTMKDFHSMVRTLSKEYGFSTVTVDRAITIVQQEQK